MSEIIGVALATTMSAHAAPEVKVTAALGRPVATGKFGAMMEVALVNAGPVTLVIDSRHRE